MKDEINRADIVVPTAGRDKSRPMYVLDIDDKGNLLVADGKLRKLETPKVKKPKHVKLLERSTDRVAEKIRIGDKLTNSEIRKQLANRGQEQTS